MSATPTRATRPQFTTFSKAAWSYHENLCAGIGNDYRIHFLNSNGVDQENLRLSRNQRATAISWSVATNILAAGWSDGTTTVWSRSTIVDGKSNNKSPITNLVWHQSLPILASTSKSGDISVWMYKDEALQQIFSVSSQLSVSKMVFAPDSKIFLYVCTSEGEIYSISKDNQELNEVGHILTPVSYFKLNNTGEELITVFGDNIMTKFATNESKLTKKSQTKLSAGQFLCTEIDDDFLCYSAEDTIYISGPDKKKANPLQVQEGDTIIGIQFYTTSNELACMTTSGRVVVWKMDREKLSFQISRRLESNITTQQAIWSPFSKIAITLASDSSFSICSVPIIHCISTRDVVVLQTDAKTLSLSGNIKKKIPFNIEKIAISGSHLLVASDMNARVFNVGYGSLETVSEFNIDSCLIEILGENIFVATGSELEVRNLQGEVKQSLPIQSSKPISQMSLNGKYLCLGSVQGQTIQLFLYDVSRRVPQLASTSDFTIKNKIYRVRSIAISRGGFCISLSLDFFVDGKWQNSKKLYLHSPQKHKTIAFDVEAGIPLSHLWDTISGRVLCIQTSTAVVPYIVDNTLLCKPLKTIAITSERAIFKIETPRVWHCLDGSRGSPMTIDGAVQASIMSQFASIDGIESGTRRILIEILYSIQTENHKNAIQIVEGINDDSQIRATLQFCLSLEDKELVDICVSKLSQNETTNEIPDDKLAFINHLSSTSYDEAAKVCSPCDKLNLKANAFLLGMAAESTGDYDKATKYFDEAGVKSTEILRMAMHRGNLSQVFKTASGNIAEPHLHKWLGRFYEYHEQYDTALSHYDICGDLRESIRLLCLMNRYDEASKRISETEQRSAICEYARILMKKLPTMKDTVLIKSTKKQIIDLFKRANQYGPAFEFVFEQDMVDDVVALSLSAPKALVAKAAMKFEEKHDIRTAALLWHRAGRMNHALNLCLENEADEALDEIADIVKQGTDPTVLVKCAEHFLEAEDFQKAANFYTLAIKIDKAIEICTKYQIKLPQELLDNLAAAKTEPEVKKQIAELCEQQEAYISAAPIYIKLNDHLSAMRNIIAAGDTDKVIKFATLLKRKDAFILAADYIACTNPRDGAPLFTTAIQFYQKASAYDKIAVFLDKSAQTEIEDFLDYTKAAELLRRAHQTMAKSVMTKERDTMVESYLQKIRWIEMYLEATQCVQSDPLRMQSLCNELLQTRGVEKCLRIEDVYMLLVQYFVTQENFAQAHRILENMRMNGVDLKWFMEEESIKRIYRAAGQMYVSPEDEQEDDEQIEDYPDDICEQISDDF